MNNTGGDDLEDDFVPDDLVALSEEDLDDDHDSNTQPLITSSANEEPAKSPASESVEKDKKRKRRQKEKERKVKKRKLVDDLNIDDSSASVTVQTPTQLADYLAIMQSKAYSNLSAMELDDIRIPESCIADTTTWTSPRTLETFGDFISKSLPTLRTRLSQKSKSNGAPTLIFLTGAALRVLEVTKLLRDKVFRGDKGGEVAKLFSRHIKLNEHIEYLKRTKVGAAVGTPGRIGKLLWDTDALSVAALSHVILDVTFRDVKKRTMLDIPETRGEVFKMVLGAPAIREGIREGKIKLVLF